MTLDEAITHTREVGLKMANCCSTKSCGEEHLQLAAWLEELKAFRETAKEYEDMKVRLDFVSNSSSSSFMLVGHAFDLEELNRGWLCLHPEDKSKFDEESEDYDEELACDTAWSLAGELGLEAEAGISDYCDQYVIGLPFEKMDDDETKRQFIERISNALKRAFPDGVSVEPLEDCGYDG